MGFLSPCQAGGERAKKIIQINLGGLKILRKGVVGESDFFWPQSVFWEKGNKKSKPCTDGFGDLQQVKKQNKKKR